MTKSARIQEKIIEILADGNYHTVQEIKSFLRKAGISDYSEGQFSGSLNTLLRNQSIQKMDRGIYKIKQNWGGKDFMKTCFVVSPIGETDSEIRSNADKLFKYIISPVCESCGFEPVRVDQINDSDSITQTIIDKLLSSELVIADISGHNPNVFFEMGYRKCTDKPIIHLKKKGETIPFDVNTVRTFEYDLTYLDNVEETKKRLEQTIGTFSFENKTNALGQDEENNKQLFFQSILTMLYQIQDSITELKEQINKKDTETIQAIMQTSLNNAQKEESTDVVMMKTLLPELIKNPKLFQNLMQFAEMTNKPKKQ
ncbi:nucleoside 2-deoxyribosyltransferase [Blautia faecis]|uniref:nucleoside 2-deoxyribosyltransferase n=1 Tax=Blautia faecis TaxID=871665 RepID=UPI001D0939D7|nr:nucleoside 2-deoxyribosyltransferase [Blautia faecis]MCB6582396.1 nucleoside 2-deoxyribosyltransferase [Blautia faecis]MCB7294942.1 nucleoside 2-deoxyribosyltransferase [Blautia faecis]